MDLRRARRAALLLATALTAGCPRPGGDRPLPEHPPAAQPTPVAAETAGLAGADVVAERVELADIGPAGVAIVFTASLKGYTEPCGCTLDLVLGGIDRVVGSVAAVRAHATAALVLDAGNVVFEHATLDDAVRAQELRKSEVIGQALRAIDLDATVPGPSDLANGLPFYLEFIAGVGAQVVASNLSAADGASIGVPMVVLPAGDHRVGVVGAVDPALFAGRSEVVASDPVVAIASATAAARAAGATTVVSLWHGDAISARRVFSAVTGVDFVVIGASPRHIDAVESLGSAIGLEAYDQGRVLGWLKLVGPADGAPWSNARVGSTAERARLARVVAGIEAQLASLPPSEGSEPAIIARQRDRIRDMQAQIAAIDSAAPVFAVGARAFLYRPIDMVPGLDVAPEITEAMRAYNLSLRTLNLASAAPPAPAPQGAPSFAGRAACARCHPAAAAFWESTHHATAWETLVARDKQFDHACVGCHVTGYGSPGGSTLGHTDGLEDVQCEQCHGPGSLHAADPAAADPARTVVRQTTPETCGSCHVPEHSPRFEYAAYRDRVVGPGHGR